MLPSLSLLPLASRLVLSPRLMSWSAPALATGGRLPTIVMTTVSVAVAPLLSVTVSVSVCVPSVKSLFVKDADVLKVVAPSCHR